MILDYVSKIKVIDEVISNEKVDVKNANNEFFLSAALSDFAKNENTIFLVYPNLYLAQKAYDELVDIVSDESILFFPGDELIAEEILTMSGDFKYERINTIISLLDKEKKYIVVMNLNSAIKYELEPKMWLESISTIKKGMDINPDNLVSYLVEIGYKATYTVTRTGEFSKRGEILDIYPLNYNSPLRLDFFDTEIETIKEFDIETQKSINEINSFTLIPVYELFYNKNSLNTALKRIEEYKNGLNLCLEESTKIENDINNLNLMNNLDNLNSYIRFFNEKDTTIFDFSNNKKIYLFDMASLNIDYKKMIKDLKEYYECINLSNLFSENNYYSLEKLIERSNVRCETTIEYFKSGIDLKLSHVEEMKGIPEVIIKNIKELSEKTTILLIKSELRLVRIKDILLENSIPYNSVKRITDIKKGIINIIYNESFFNLSLNDKEINIINESALFDNKYNFRRPKYKSVYKNTTKVSHYNELKLNDYVVHFDYGVGIYEGLQTLTSDNKLRDYLKIKYEDGSLYIPLEQINRIEKFNTGETDIVTINKLKSNKWHQAKEKVRARVKDISDKLVKMYSTRQKEKGFAFETDSTLELEFETSFPFELTSDQEKAINDVKRDMESDKVMDRLICGDVGYGKTEVALRAAFKAVMNAKQVALLAPTTILVNQHYKTFKNRMESFGVRVEFVNRFVSKKEQTKIIELLKNGEVDVLIGTHRILSSDFVFKDLGLLIIDEEQRFGVMHKEKIREMKANVDTITLSATPIPRTLQMSIAGMKDLSMIETPPKNRYPIQTYVIERNDAIIKDAITREMARGGQVFYMYNLVSTIEEKAYHIQTLVPEARICIAHGQMEKNELENKINEFINHEYDVLVCTTIIETGIDIPDCNTLIVDDATRLGLSQLYQLRGRVGRSDRIAYAYLMYTKEESLTENTKKRLEAIKEFNELGSGYKIAMRDLAIRGAGDILGGEQSGFITSVGLETFMHILNEEIDKVKDPLKVQRIEDIKPRNIQLVSRTISSAYIANEAVKIEIHKKIDKLNSKADLDILSGELIDRFGPFDDTIKYYMYEKLFTNLINLHNVEHIESGEYEISLYFTKEESARLDGNKLFETSNKIDKNIRLKYINKQIVITYTKEKKEPNKYLIILSRFLEELYK